MNGTKTKFAPFKQCQTKKGFHLMWVNDNNDSFFVHWGQESAKNYGSLKLL